MCTYNTLLLPGSMHIDPVNELARDELGRLFAIQGHVGIEQAISEDAKSYIKDKHCDCGMGLARRKALVPIEPATEQDLKKLRSKGWSNAKIERWLAQRKATLEKQKLISHRSLADHQAITEAPQCGRRTTTSIASPRRG